MGFRVCNLLQTGKGPCRPQTMFMMHIGRHITPHFDQSWKRTNFGCTKVTKLARRVSGVIILTQYSNIIAIEVVIFIPAKENTAAGMPPARYEEIKSSDMNPYN
jgi:hypothetical protein